MRSRARRLVRDQRGFTLVELLVTMVMMTIVMFALYSIFDTGIRVFSFGNDKVNVAENARIGLEKMEREIRAAYPVDKVNGIDYLFFAANGSTSDPPQAMPTSTQITFGNELSSPSIPPNRKIDCNPSGAASGTSGYTPCEYITYKLTSTSAPSQPCTKLNAPCTLRRVNKADSSDAGDAVVENVKPPDPTASPSYPGGLTFTYLKSDGTTPATSESEIAIVRIKLEIEIDRGQSLGKRTQTLTTDVALRNRSN